VCIPDGAAGRAVCVPDEPVGLARSSSLHNERRRVTVFAYAGLTGLNVVPSLQRGKAVVHLGSGRPRPKCTAWCPAANGLYCIGSKVYVHSKSLSNPTEG
jgi:hypothetical protein